MTIFTDEQKAALNTALAILANMPDAARIHLFAELDDGTDNVPGSPDPLEYLFSIRVQKPQTPTTPSPKENPPVTLKATTGLKTRLNPSTNSLLGAHGIVAGQLVTVTAVVTAEDRPSANGYYWRKLVAPGDPVDGYWVAETEIATGVVYLVNP